MAQRNRRAFWKITLVAGAALAACSPGVKHVPPPLEAPDAFSSTGTDLVPERWWTAFDDPGLNAVVDSALTSNFDLKVAWQRIRAANAVVRRESGALYPDLEAFGRAAARDGSEEFVQSGDFELGLASVYEVDLWGRIRSARDAEQFRARATYADYQTAALSLSAEIVRTWYRLAAARDQLVLIEEQVETNRTVLGLLRNRFGVGQVRSVDIIRQEQLVAAREEQLGYARSTIAVLEHRLAVLLGQSPIANLASAPDSLPELPPLPKTGIPLELVQRRPDVRRAFNLVHAADRDLATAVSSRYPRLSLSASVATESGSAGNLFDGWISSLVGSAVAPLFKGGELRAEVDRTEAVKQQRLYEYGQTVLVAFQEVEDALVLETNQLQSLRSIEEQTNLAEQAYERLGVEYLNGTSNYLDVLTALDEVQRLRRAHVAAELILVEYRIALYRALAGPFETALEISD